MSLFSNEVLNQVFPEATPDALADPNSEIYSKYANAYIQSQESAGRLALTGGNEDAIAEILRSGIVNKNYNSSEHIKSVIEGAYIDTTNLFSEIMGTIPISTHLLNKTIESIEMDSFVEIYGKFDDLKLDPEVVFTPEGFTLSFWENLYTNLYDWQKQQDPANVADKLGNWSDDEILIADNLIKDNWTSFIDTNNQKWTVNIVANTHEAPIKQLTYFGKNHSKDDSVSEELDGYKFLMKSKNHAAHLHPTIETYLTQQALSIMIDGHALDYSRTKNIWLRNISYLAPGHRAPIIRFDHNTKKLIINCVEVDGNIIEDIRPTYTAPLKDGE